MHSTTKYLSAGISVFALSATLAMAQDQPSVPAWAAEATMNPDYVAGAGSQSATPPEAEPAAAPASETAAPASEPEAAAAPASAANSTTEYFGDSKPTASAPFAAEATMNPDYSADGAASPAASSTDAAAETPAAAPSETPAETTATTAAEEPSLPMTPPGNTEFYGAPAAGGTPAWAAEATMNPNYSASSATPPAAASETPAASAEPASAGASACLDGLNAALNAGKITFGAGSFAVLPSSYATLDKIAEVAKTCSGVTVEVGGHTDNTGSTAGNEAISELRAKAVVRYLTRAGVDAAMLKAKGYGESKPVASNDTSQGRRQNRRIEFAVSP